MENHYNCIYMYTNKINGKRYVGQTNDFNRRHKEHIAAMTNENDDEYNKPIHRALRKYGLNNFDVKILKESLNTQCLLNFYECYYIKKFDLLCKNGKGYNLSDGGSNGNPFAGKTEEEIKQWKQKISENHADMKGENNPMYGIHKYGKDNPMYSKHHSEGTKQKISESLKGKNKGENHPRSKRVAQYDKRGNLIRIWDYAKQVTEELGISDSHIITCCKWYDCGEDKEKWSKIYKYYPHKSAGGYIWKYVDAE